MESASPLFKKFAIITVHGEYIKAQLLDARVNIKTQTTGSQIHGYDTRVKDRLRVPFTRLCLTDSRNDDVRLYNPLPATWKVLPLYRFKRTLIAHLAANPIYALEEIRDSLDRGPPLTV